MDDVSDIDVERRYQLERACIDMKAYCKKLVTGEEMIGQSSRCKNLSSSSQLHKIVEKMDETLECIDRNYFRDDYVHVPYGMVLVPQYLVEQYLVDSDDDW